MSEETDPAPILLSEAGAQQDGELCGHRYGNFGSYYNFHSADERIDQIEAQSIRDCWIKGGSPSSIAILDIGCNEGDLSVGLVRKMRECLGGIRCFLLGVRVISPCLFI
jgi:hypothetical protein